MKTSSDHPHYFLCAFFGALGALVVGIALYFMIRVEAPQLVSVDLNRLTFEAKQKLLDKARLTHGTTKEMEQEFKGFGQQLEHTLEQYAGRHQVTIIMSQALVAGTLPDITAEIAKTLDGLQPATIAGESPR